MPSPTRTLTARTARDLILDSSFPESSTKRVGVEVEFFTTPSSSPPDVPALREILDPLPLPFGSAITYEPGAQVELSSQPFPTLDESCAAIAMDADLVRAELRGHGIGTFAVGVDPDRPLMLRTAEPRYVAMRSHWDATSDAGARMMCTSASVHVNVDASRDPEGARRWELAHRIGPTLVAAFANSAIVDGGEASGWKSSRMATWQRIDPSRTAPAVNGSDPADSWCDYSLAANVMFIRAPERFVPITDDFPFARWIDDGHELGFPTPDDLAYHLTTLFPPVRPHGRLELRMIDMLPDPWWRVAVAVTTSLLYDEEASERAHAATHETDGRWREAAYSALDHPALAASALTCFEAAIGGLERMGTERETIDLVSDYMERFVRIGRCPADEQLAHPTERIAEVI